MEVLVIGQAVAAVQDNEDSLEENPSDGDDDVVLGSQFDEGAAGDARLKLNVLMSCSRSSETVDGIDASRQD